MIKVLHVMPMMGVGGASNLMSEIIPNQNAHPDIKAELVISKFLDKSFLPRYEKAGVKVHVIGGGSTLSLKNIFHIASLIKDYDVIHVHLFPSLYWVALANIFIKKPLVYTEHSTSNSRRGKWFLRGIEKLAYKHYRRIICISEQTQISLRDWIKAKDNDSRFVVINNGVDLNSFKDIEGERLYPHTLIMVARFAAAKDHETVIKAMTLLDDNVHLIFVGDGERKSTCEKLVDELGLNNRIHFAGVQSDIPKWLGKADIGIQSSHWEGFGLAAVEMMAAGLPVVASDVDGLKQVVDGAGALFPHGDYKKLAEEVKKLIYDKDYYDSTKQKCLDRSKFYGIDSTVQKYIDVYKDILS
jgi:glycosyltransferase involved in cell wall biosynthesis